MLNEQPTLLLELSIPTFLFEKCREQPVILLEILTNEQRAQIKAFIFDSLHDKDGAPEAEDFSISSFRYSEEEGSGTFRLHFSIDRRFCCADVESSRQDYMDFHFTYISETLKATANYFNWDFYN